MFGGIPPPAAGALRGRSIAARSRRARAKTARLPLLCTCKVKADGHRCRFSGFCSRSFSLLQTIGFAIVLARAFLVNSSGVTYLQAWRRMEERWVFSFNLLCGRNAEGLVAEEVKETKSE